MDRGLKKGLKRVAALFLTLVMVFAFGDVPALAKTKTVKTKAAEYFTTESYIKKKAGKVKKGTYLVKPNRKKGGYLKFTAPKTKTYKFTISHYSTEKSYCNGYWSIMTRKKNGIGFYPKSVKTQGGSNDSMYISSSSNTSGEMKYRFLESRYAKTKIKKGQTVYIYLKYTGGNVILKIK